MSIDHKHRETEDRNEIIKVLNEVFLKDHELKIWQKKDGSLRKVVDAIVDDVDPENKVISFQNKNKMAFDFEKDSEVFFRCEHQFLTFKTSRFFEKDNILFIDIPGVVHLKENRTEPRKTFEITKLPKTSVKLVRNSIKSVELELPCLDLSEKAMALQVSSSNIHQIYEGEDIKIIAFEGINIPLQLMGEVSYIQEQKRSSGGTSSYRVVLIFTPKSQGQLIQLL